MRYTTRVGWDSSRPRTDCDGSGVERFGTPAGVVTALRIRARRGRRWSRDGQLEQALSSGEVDLALRPYDRIESEELSLYLGCLDLCPGSPALGHVVGTAAVWARRIWWLGVGAVIWAASVALGCLLGVFVAPPPTGTGAFWGALIGAVAWPVWCALAARLQER